MYSKKVVLALITAAALIPALTTMARGAPPGNTLEMFAEDEPLARPTAHSLLPLSRSNSVLQDIVATAAGEHHTCGGGNNHHGD